MNDVSTRSARRINLSYVLHEPSTSAPIEQIMGLIEREEKRVARLVSGLTALSDDRLKQRTVRRQRAGAPDNDPVTSIVLLTLRLGAWRLVERLFRVTDPTGRYQGVPCLTQTLDAGTGTQAVVPLFRGDAQLTLPDMPAAETAEFWLTVALVRPGATSLHLETIYLGRSNDHDTRAWLQTALPWIETILREQLTQWFADRPLWTEPVESRRPEFIQRSGHH